jgi:2-methylcitrate dehydratase PrpD
VALREHSFGVAHLTKAHYTDPVTLALASKVTTVVDPAVQAVYPKQRGARVIITLKSGTALEKELYDLKGSPNNPVGWPELEAKFIANAKASLSMASIKSLLVQIANLETLSSIDEMLDLLV